MDYPNILSHVSIGVPDLERSAAFYDAVLACIGARRIEEFPGAIGYGRIFPEFWIGRPLDGGAPGGPANGTHFGFLAQRREEVDAFWAAALAHGATEDGAPGLRLDYGPGYYACYLRDPDGHKIEAHSVDNFDRWTSEAGEEPEAHPT